MAFRSNHRQDSKKHDKNTLPVRVASMECELEFRLEKNATGQDLFDLVCRTVGLRETWYFGLQYMDSRGFITWLKMNKPVRSQDVPKQEIMQFMLLVKFFPEEANEELIQDITIRLFFLQVKESILRMHVYCPAETATILASYACQAQYGDLDENVYRPGMLCVDEVVPKQVITQFQMTQDMWEQRIRYHYADHRGMLREEAELNYVNLAQNLDMYGVNYFQIYNMRKSELWLGVTAFGLNVYDKENRLTPKISFAWSEIRNISFEGKRFIIKPVDRRAPNFVFYSPKLRANKIILDLCMGNHDLYVRRRQPDTMELQQMKAQKKELKMRRDIERSKLLHEKQMKLALQRDKEELERRLMQYQEEIRMANEALVLQSEIFFPLSTETTQRRSEQSAEILADKSRLAEYEVAILQQKAEDAEREVERIRSTINKSEEEKATIEKKLFEAERNASCMAEEAEQRNHELRELRSGLLNARYAEKSARDKLIEITTNLPTRGPKNIANNNNKRAIAPLQLLLPAANTGSSTSSAPQQSSMQQQLSANSENNKIQSYIATNGEAVSHADAATVSSPSSSTDAASPEFTKNHQQYYFGGNNVNPDQQQQQQQTTRASPVASLHAPTLSSSSTVYAVSTGATCLLYPSSSFSSHAPPVMPNEMLLVGRAPSGNNSSAPQSAQNSPTLSLPSMQQPSTINNIVRPQLKSQYVKYTFIEPSSSSTNAAGGYSANTVLPNNNESCVPLNNNGNRALMTGSQQQLPTYEQHIMLNITQNGTNQTPTLDGEVLAGASSSSINGSGNDDDEIEELARQIENEQRHMMEKSRNLQRQLMDMRREFDGLRLDEQLTSLDRIHLERKGETKHSTLQKATSGATARRVAFFDKL